MPRRPRRTLTGAARNWTRKTLFVGGVLLTLWLILAAVVRAAGCPPDPAFAGWWQLGSGSSWPEDWQRLCERSSGTFALLAGARMVLGLAGPLVVLATFIWLLFVGWEIYMAMTRVQLLRQLVAELVPSLHDVVRKHHPTASQEVLDRELEDMKTVAAGIVEGYAEDLDRIEKRQQRPASMGY